MLLGPSGPLQETRDAHESSQVLQHRGRRHVSGFAQAFAQLLFLCAASGCAAVCMLSANAKSTPDFRNRQGWGPPAVYCAISAKAGHRLCNALFPEASRQCSASTSRQGLPRPALANGGVLDSVADSGTFHAYIRVESYHCAEHGPLASRLVLPALATSRSLPSLCLCSARPLPSPGEWLSKLANLAIYEPSFVLYLRLPRYAPARASSGPNSQRVV